MTTIYGHDIDLPDREAIDGVVTDVIVIARAVTYDHKGEADETIIARHNPNISHIIRRGMCEIYLDAITDETRGEA
ncbi:MAG: hypothetical protein ACTH9H_12935 [Galactobacter sp.]